MSAPAGNYVTLSEAAAILQISLSRIRRSETRAKFGLLPAKHPSCMDDRLGFLDRASVEAAAANLQITRSLIKKGGLIAPLLNTKN